MTSTIVLITGANSGIGFATAKVLACASDTFHIIMASRCREKGQAAMSELEAAKPKGALSTVQLASVGLLVSGSHDSGEIAGLQFNVAICKYAIYSMRYAPRGCGR